MPVLQPLVQSTPRLLDLVNAVLDDVKQPNITTVIGAKAPARVIVQGINDALIDLFTRVKWSFREASAAVNLVVGQRDYLVPADFGSIEGDIVAENLTVYYVPKNQLQSSLNISGPVATFTLIDADHFRFDPTPNADFVAKFPQLLVDYLRRPVLVKYDDDVPSVPIEFQDILKTMGRLRWKKMNEYSTTDINDEKATYEQLIALKTMSYLTTPGKRQGMKLRLGQNPRTPYRKPF